MIYLKKQATRLEKLAMHMRNNSDKTSIISGKHRSSLNHIRKKCKSKEKIGENGGRDNEKKRSVEMNRSSDDDTNERNDESEKDTMLEHAKENVVRIRESKNKKSRNCE